VLDAHRTADLGYVLAADGAGLVAVSLLGGVLADRFRRSRMMIGADALRFCATVGFGLGAASAPLPLAVVLAALMGVGLGLFQPAYGALVPSVVSRRGPGRGQRSGFDLRSCRPAPTTPSPAPD
jgi:MFS family permease